MQNSVNYNDWIIRLQGPIRKEFCALVRKMSLDKLQKYPLRKCQGFPIGREIRILLRYLGGQNSLFDSSAFWWFYRLFASARDKSLYRVFIESAPVSKNEWCNLIGVQNVDEWMECKLFEEKPDGRLRCRFRIISIGKIILVTDSLPTFPYRVHIGQDSLDMIEFLSKRVLPYSGRYLDVGTGSAAVLLKFFHSFDETIGIDINPRAVQLARLNADLNLNSLCQIYHDDIFNIGNKYGLFDLVTWNAPFIFFPEKCKDNNLDGYGGNMGIEITLKFIEKLPELLKERGEAYILSSAPILKSGVDVLKHALLKLIVHLRLDINVYALKCFWVPHLLEFHERHGICRFENVILQIRHGNARLHRFKVPVAKRTIDRIGGLLYHERLRDLFRNRNAVDSIDH